MIAYSYLLHNEKSRKYKDKRTREEKKTWKQIIYLVQTFARQLCWTNATCEYFETSLTEHSSRKIVRRGKKYGKSPTSIHYYKVKEGLKVSYLIKKWSIRNCDLSTWFQQIPWSHRIYFYFLLLQKFRENNS